MSYTVNKLAKLSGVSPRTLRFYDEIGLLKPAAYGENKYRYYEEEQLLLLQQILFFRELDFPLGDIEGIMSSPDFDKVETLNAHKITLQARLENCANCSWGIIWQLRGMEEAVGMVLLEMPY